MKKKIVITAGGTVENIDGVRQMTNFSTGGLGYEMCRTFLDDFSDQIEKIFYICPPSAKQPPVSKLVTVFPVSDVQSVLAQVQDILDRDKVHVFIHSMAVSDYSTDYVSNAKTMANEIVKRLEVQELKNGLWDDKVSCVLKSLLDPQNKMSTDQKISSSEKDLMIHLTQTPKIIHVIKKMQPDLCLVGFKLLRNVSRQKLLDAAGEVMIRNDCDLVVANDLQFISGHEHKAMIVHHNGVVEYASTKKEIASLVCDACIRTANVDNDSL